MRTDPYAVADPNVKHAMLVTFSGSTLSVVKENIKEIRNNVPAEIGFLALVDGLGSETEVLELRAGTSKLLHSFGAGDAAEFAAAIKEFLARGMSSFPAASLAVGFRSHGDFLRGGVAKILARKFIRAIRDRLPRRWRLNMRPPFRLRLPPQETLLPLDAAFSLGLEEAGDLLREALHGARQDKPVSLLFFDTCVNGCVEVLEELSFFGAHFIGSQAVEPDDGWIYGPWFEGIIAPGATGESIAKLPVELFPEVCKSPRGGDEWWALSAFRSPAPANDDEGTAITSAFAELVRALPKPVSAPFPSAKDHLQSYRRHDTGVADLLEMVSFLEQEYGPARPEVGKAANRVRSAFDAALLSTCTLSFGLEHSLNGLGIWCPDGPTDFKDHRSAYSKLCFDRLTRWSEAIAPAFGF